nr:uncharacterized protein LOC119163867 [Rhipicephalus microplus]
MPPVLLIQVLLGFAGFNNVLCNLGNPPVSTTNVTSWHDAPAPDCPPIGHFAGGVTSPGPPGIKEELHRFVFTGHGEPLSNLALSMPPVLLIQVNQLEKEAVANVSNSTSVSDLESKVVLLENQVSEKNKMLKLQQQRMSDMKKTLQKELKNHQGAATVTAVLNIEGSSCTASDVPPPVDHGGSAGDSAAKAETALQDAAQPQRSDSKLEDDINFKYLKHVVFKFMTSKEDEAQHLIRAVSVLLRFTADEEQMIREHLEWKNSWFGMRPQPHYAPLHSLPQYHHGHNTHHHRSSSTSGSNPKSNTKTT